MTDEIRLTPRRVGVQPTDRDRATTDRLDPCTSMACGALNRHPSADGPWLACPVCGSPTVQPRSPR